MQRGSSTIEELWVEAEEALESSSKRAEGLLTKLASKAEEGSEASLFAYRHLAEINLERNPWKAALQLRCVLAHCDDDDVLYALMGLCHALLGNYRVAVRAYGEAARLSPMTPWYHHNLGHLMDVALGKPDRAEAHLRRAFELEPDHDEIIGSLAHCVARLGDLPTAKQLAELALEKGPCNPDHRALIQWIDAGGIDAPVTAVAPNSTLGDDTAASSADPVVASIQVKMREAGYTREQIERAKQLWADMQDRCDLRVTKPEVLAAALEYAIAVVERRPGCTQAEIARRYGVAATSVSTRFVQIRNALALRPGDPRYAAG